MSLNVMPQLTQKIYELYLNGNLKVNRRYQRKLVWSIEEKQSFIDSLIKGYPIPMILTSKIGQEEYEVLDGLQRLNAITSFIEREFSLNGKYFDVNSITLTQNLRSSNNEKVTILTNEENSNFLNYPIPFAVTDNDNKDFIDETFRRINTKGRQLSKHDLRQAGALGVIPNIVNTVAMYVRKDSSQSNVLTLKQMKNISIGDDKLKYGINISNIVWVSNGIISKNEIRKSRDEELIAHLVGYILDPNAQTTASYLDEMYDVKSNIYKILVTEINKYGDEFIITSINHVFDEIFTKIFNNNRENFSNTVYKDEKSIKSSSSFQIIFLSLYELIIKENKRINNYKDLHNSLDGISKNYAKIFNSNKKWHNRDRQQLIKATKGIISEHFSSNSESVFAPKSWIKNLENLINESSCEQNFFDFKIGFIDLSPKEDSQSYKLNKKLVEKVIKTLAAMTNTVREECMVIVGIADTEADAQQHKTILNSAYPTNYQNKIITGVQDEAKLLYLTNSESESLERYISAIKTIIKADSKASEQFRDQICQKMVHFPYKEKEIIVFTAQRGEQVEFYDNKIFVRNVSDNTELPVGSEQFMNKIKNF